MINQAKEGDQSVTVAVDQSSGLSDRSGLVDRSGPGADRSGGPFLPIYSGRVEAYSLIPHITPPLSRK